MFACRGQEQAEFHFKTDTYSTRIRLKTRLSTDYYYYYGMFPWISSVPSRE